MHVKWFRTINIMVITCAILCLPACKERQAHCLGEPIIVSEYTIQIGKGQETMRSNVFDCICKINGRVINCRLVNCSSSCLLYNHQEDGPIYYLDYLSKAGVQKSVITTWIESMYFPHLVALYPEGETLSQGASHSFNIPVPPDCKKILSLTFVISYVPFSAMGTIQDINDLRDAFMHTNASVSARFEP